MIEYGKGDFVLLQIHCLVCLIIFSIELYICKKQSRHVEIPMPEVSPVALPAGQGSARPRRGTGLTGAAGTTRTADHPPCTGQGILRICFKG